jgi:branched-chain amino acid transport system permease protein
MGRRGAVLAVHLGVVLALGLLQVVLPPYHHGLVARALVLAAYATAYNLLLGYTGLMSLGHALFFAAGMYGAGLSIQHLGFGALPAFAVGVGGAALAAFGVGLVAVRVVGAAFLIVTLMLAQAGYLAILHFNEVTQGDQGFVLAGLGLDLGGGRLVFAAPAVKYNVALGVFALCLGVTLAVVRSPVGSVLVAIRENEERTQLLGYATPWYRLGALLLSGTLAGAAGATYTLLFSYVGATFAGILYSIYPLLWTLLGGAGTTLGPLVGTLLMTYVVDVASGLTSGYLLVVGLVLLGTVLWVPAGLVGALRARWAPWLP